MSVHQTTDAATVAAIHAAPRALVFLSVPWSGPERLARAAFFEAATTLETEYPELGVQFYLLDEDADECRSFVASLLIPHLSGTFSAGAGSLLWLDKGRLVSYEISGCEGATKGIARQTIALWHDGSEPAE